MSNEEFDRVQSSSFVMPLTGARRPGFTMKSRYSAKTCLEVHVGPCLYPPGSLGPPDHVTRVWLFNLFQGWQSRWLTDSVYCYIPFPHISPN